MTRFCCQNANMNGEESVAARSAAADLNRHLSAEPSIVMADSRIGDNVESPLVQPVVDSSTTDVDASKTTTTTASSASASGAEPSISSSKTSENKSDNDATPVTLEKQPDNVSNKNGIGQKGQSSADDSTPAASKDGAQSVESEHETAMSGTASPTKVDRKIGTKKHSFKPVSVTKQFLKESNPATTNVSTTISASPKPQGTAGSPNLSTATPRPATVSKLKLVRSGGSLQMSKTNGTGPGGASSKADPQPVWNKNKAPPPPIQTSQLTDEELTRKFGIHLASRLGPEEHNKEAKWADIEDDDDDWIPETLEWDHKIKVATPVDSKAPRSPASPKPEQPTPKDTQPPATSSSAPTSGNRTVLKAKTTLVTNKEASKSPEPVAVAPVTKSPWAKIPAPAIVPIPPATKPSHGEPRRDELSHKDTLHIKDVSAEGYDRTWRDRTGGPMNRELFNSQTGQMEPAPEGRNRNLRLSRHDPPMAKPAVLQRPSGSGYQPPEPSPAFQTHRTRPEDFRRRTNSNMSGGSGGFRRPSFSRPSIDGDDYGPTSVFDDDMPLPPRSSRGPRGSMSPGFPPPSFGHHDSSPRYRPVFPQGDAGAQPIPPTSSESPVSQEQSTPTEPGPSAADILEMQKRVMKESREKARQRRLEEEARLEAEKRERLAAKIAELDRLAKEKQEKEAAEKAAEEAEKERIAAEAKAEEEKRLAAEREAAEKKREEEEQKRKEAEAVAKTEQTPPNRAEAATQWRRSEPPKFADTSSPQHPQPAPVWSSDRVRSVFSEEARPSTSTSTPLPNSFPRTSQQSFSSDSQVAHPISTPDASFINDASHPSFLPSSDASSTSSPHPIPGTQARQQQGIYQVAPLRGPYPQFSDQMHGISPAPIGPGNISSGFPPSSHPGQSQPQWPRQHGSQYGAIGDRTNRDQNDRGQVSGVYHTFGHGPSSAIPPGHAMQQNYGRGNMYQANQRFASSAPHQFNGNDNRGGYSNFTVHTGPHQPGYRNQPGIPPSQTLNDQSAGSHDPFYPGPPRQTGQPSNMASGRSPTFNNAQPYRGQGRRSPFINHGGQSPNINNAHIYQQYGRDRRSPGGLSPNLNHAQIYHGNRQGRPPSNVSNYPDMRHPNNNGSTSPNISHAGPGTVGDHSPALGQENNPSSQDDSIPPPHERGVKVAASDHQQNLKILADAKSPGVSAWANYNAAEDDAQRAAQALAGGAQESRNVEPATDPTPKQTIVFRHKQEKQTEAQADAEVAAWASRRGKAAVAIPEHFKPGYTPPARDVVASALPPHLKAKTRAQEVDATPPFAPPQSPPPPISDDHPVHGDLMPRVHLPGQHDRRVATSTSMSQSDRISSVQDRLLSVMSQHRPTTIEPRGDVTVVLPPTGDDRSICSMPSAEEFQEALNHQPFGSTPTIRLPQNMQYPELVPTDAPQVPTKPPKADCGRPLDFRYHSPYVVIIGLPGTAKKEISWRPKRVEGSGRGRWGKRRGDMSGRSEGSGRGGRGRGRQRGVREEAKAAAA